MAAPERRPHPVADWLGVAPRPLMQATPAAAGTPRRGIAVRQSINASVAGARALQAVPADAPWRGG
jgi:hypothetical protein